MSSSYLDNGSTTPVVLDGRAPSNIVVTSKDVQDPERLARMVQELAREVVHLKRTWTPSRMYFRDRTVTATNTTKILFHHGFGGRVNWWVARWDSLPAAAGAPYGLDEHADSDANTLVLVSSVAGVVTICVEAAG